MSTPHEPLADLAAAYSLGALDAEDLVRFEEHLRSGCAECRRALADHRDALVQVARAVGAPPPPRARRRLMERVGRGRARRPASGRFWSGFRWAASVAVAAGLLAAVISTFVSARYEARLGQMAREVAALREQMQQQLVALTLLRDPVTRVVALAGLAPSPNARGRMIWHEVQGGVLVAADLPPVPPGQIYELWAIVEGKPIPAGLFTVDGEGRGGVRVAALPGAPRVDQFAVTLEPAGGAPAPTGPMYLASK
jgi:anti-sigma-K factor RskA